MKIIELKRIEHDKKKGQSCEFIEPNIKEDCYFSNNGSICGFYLKKMPKELCDLASIADKEFRSNRVPKSKMNRGTKEQAIAKGAEWISQYSTIIGSCAPKAHMRLDYARVSAVHQSKSAETFMKAMLLLCEKAELLLKEYMPEQYEKQIKLIEENCPEKWRFGKLFTSSISNFNISAPYHVDTANIKDTVNIIITKRMFAEGGCLNVPDYGATIEQCDNSILVYPAWMNLHGVTPIKKSQKHGYRNSLIFYPLKSFKGLD